MRIKNEVLNHLVIGFVLLGCVVTEIVTGFIYDVVTIPAILAGLVWGGFSKQLLQRIQALVVMFVLSMGAAIFLSLLTDSIIIGGGSLKLLFAVATFYTPGRAVLIFLFYAILHATFYALNSYFPGIGNFDTYQILFIDHELIRSGLLIFTAFLVMLLVTKVAKAQR